MKFLVALFGLLWAAGNLLAAYLFLTSGMLPNFVDTWTLVGSGRGLTAFGPSPTMKLDYWFNDLSGRAIPQSTQVIYWTGISDHYPVQTTFVVK